MQLQYVYENVRAHVLSRAALIGIELISFYAQSARCCELSTKMNVNVEACAVWPQSVQRTEAEMFALGRIISVPHINRN